MARCRKMVKGKGGRSRQCRNTTNGKSYCHAHARRRSRSRSRSRSRGGSCCGRPFPGYTQAGGAGEVQAYAAVSNRMNTSLRELCTLAGRPNLTPADRLRIANLAKITGENAMQANALEKQMAGVVNQLKGNLTRLNAGITQLDSQIKNMRTATIDTKFNTRKRQIDDQYSKQVAELNALKVRETQAFNAQIAKMNNQLVKMGQQRDALQNQINNLTGGVTQMQKSSQAVATTMATVPRTVTATQVTRTVPVTTIPVVRR